MRFLAFLFLAFSSPLAFAAAPLPPTDVTAVASTGKSIRISWTASSGATSYRVYRDESATPLTTTSSTSYTDADPNLVAGTTYSYRVSALNIDGESTLSSPAASASPVDTPGAPANLRATDITSTSVSLAWNSVDGATSYTIYRDDEVVEEDITGTTFEDIGLTLSTTYTYNVTATSAGGESAKSADLVITTFGDGTGKEAVWAKRFRQIDTDASGALTYEEYFLGHGGRLAEVVIMHRYEYMDSDETTEGVTLTEYAKSFGGRKFMSPSRPRQFLLADLDANGALDPDEFSLTLGARTPWSRVVKIFNKKNKIKDDEEDLWLSEFEFGIRTGSSAEPDDV